MKARINMLGILTNNFEGMKQFYSEVMGFPIQFEMEANYVEFENDGVRFAISTLPVMREATGHTSYDKQPEGHSFELAFEADSAEDVDRSYQTLIKKGATPIKEAQDMPWGQRAAFFADPDGNIHEIFCNL